tara:strand:+ start:443 stop:745 length:303 start_codon:yes stop_codon:yes gene_type:complete
MATRHYNVVNEITTELLAPGDNTRVTSVSLANVQGTNACAVDLFIEKVDVGKYYFIKQVNIPADTSLVVDVKLDNSSGEFGLYVKLTASTGTPAVDIILI